MVKNIPSNELVEKNILGIVLVTPKKCFNILSNLNEDDFYANNFRQRYVFQAMIKLTDKNEEIIPSTLYTQLVEDGTFEKVGGEEYISDLIDGVTSNSDKTIETYIKTLQDLSLLRQFLFKIDSIETEYNKSGLKADVSGFLARSEAGILEITNKRKISGFSSLNELSRAIGNKIKTGRTSQDTITGSTTGYPTLDKWINGLNGGKLYVIAARTAMGKSAFALNIAYYNALRTSRPVAFFSLEMDKNELTSRIIASRARVQMSHIQNSFLTQDERMHVLSAVEEMQKVQMYIDDTSGATIDDIILKAKKLKEDKGDLGLIVIDYIGLISEGNHKFNSEQEKLGYFSRRLKQTASELNCPLICLAQINRDTENNKANTRIPTLANIKSSDAIAADSDVVIFIYREDYYRKQGVLSSKGANKDSKPLDASATSLGDSNNIQGEPAQIIIAKNRNGKTGTMDFLYFGPYLSFDEPDDSTRDILRRNRNAE